jgi:hypothetical protein
MFGNQADLDSMSEIQSSPISTQLEFESDATAKSKTQFQIPPPINDEECQLWMTTQPQDYPRRRIERKRKSKSIVLRPFASFEATEFCVRTLSALMNGTSPPLSYAQELEMIARRRSGIIC